MNERIKQLEAQASSLARELVPDLRDIPIYERIRSEKFAELMIKDSIQTLINNGYDDAAKCLHEVHFGIEG